MIFFKKKKIAAVVSWKDGKGRNKSSRKDIVTLRKKNIIVFRNINGGEVRVRVEL